MKLTTTIDVTLGRGQNMREHYRVRANRVKAEREATREALEHARCEPPQDRWMRTIADHFDMNLGARVTLMRPIARIALDSDNLSGAFKGVRDEVASFLGVDDKSERIHWVYTQEKGKGLKPTITIEVMSVEDIDPQVKRVRELEELVGKMLLSIWSLRYYVTCLTHLVDGHIKGFTYDPKHDPDESCLQEALESLEETKHYGGFPDDFEGTKRRLLGMVTT